jgi:transcriptional regulator with XRE-family HTH domain
MSTVIEERMSENEFGKAFKKLREEQGFSIKKLAGSLQVNYTYLSKIENNKSIPSDEFIDKIAELFKVDADELKMQAGKIPEDVKKIIKNNSKEVIEYLRGKFG